VRPVGEEHHAELAHDRIEGRVLEGQLHRVGLAPFDRARRADLGGLVEHRLVEIGGDEARARRESSLHEGVTVYWPSSAGGIAASETV